MRKLFVYGDSFSTSHRAPSWTGILSGLLDAELVNFAVDGGSSENAMIKFHQSTQDNVIQDGDVIVMQLSTPGRIHFKIQRSYPNTASVFLHDLSTNDTYYRTLPWFNWWKDNKSFLEWYIINMDVHLYTINHESYIHVMKNFAEANPTCTVVLLQNAIQPVKFPITTLPPNFLMPDISLFEASMNELQASMSFEDWVKCTIWDRRNNHLSVPNVEILSNALLNAINEKDVSKIQYDVFEKNVFATPMKAQADFEHYIKLGLLVADRFPIG